VLVYDSVLEKHYCLTNCDLTGFVYPVLGSTLSNPQREIIEQMLHENWQKVFLIGNYDAFTGDTGIYWKKVIEQKGYDVVYADHVHLPIKSMFPGFSMFPVPNEEKQKRMIAKAEKRIDIITKNIVKGVRRYRGYELFDKIGGSGQRKYYDPIVDKFIAGMFIDSERCVMCGLCYKICPAEAISKDETGNCNIDSNKCIFCLKCYNYCPHTAALKDAESVDRVEFMRYKGLSKFVKPIQYR
jgi:ferredoxin